MGSEEKRLISSVKTELGFLFNGFKLKRYYWEVVLVSRKVLIIASAVFLSPFSAES